MIVCLVYVERWLLNVEQVIVVGALLGRLGEYKAGGCFATQHTQQVREPEHEKEPKETTKP